MQIIKIELNLEEAERYKEFCRHYKNMNVLLKSGFFSTKNGSIIAHFNNDGVINSLQKSEVVYTDKF